ANVLQIFVDDTPFAFLPGEKPQSLDEILDILGALPTNLAPEFVYYETRTRDNLSGVTSLQKKTPMQFEGDVAISFYTETGLGTFIARANLEPSNPSTRERIADATSIYLNSKVIPMLPKELSNDICSLRPLEKRLTLVCEMFLDKDCSLKTFKS
ncbi:MAG: RNB domain-containing ribonuclease, partial [Gammaproteobacteria bacterium]